MLFLVFPYLVIPYLFLVFLYLVSISYLVTVFYISIPIVTLVLTVPVKVDSFAVPVCLGMCLACLDCASYVIDCAITSLTLPSILPVSTCINIPWISYLEIHSAIHFPTLLSI